MEDCLEITGRKKRCGSVMKTVAGVLVIAILEAGLSQTGATEPVKRLVTGFVIVLAVIVDALRSRRAGRE